MTCRPPPSLDLSLSSRRTVATKDLHGTPESRASRSLEHLSEVLRLEGHGIQDGETHDELMRRVATFLERFLLAPASTTLAPELESQPEPEPEPEPELDGEPIERPHTTSDRSEQEIVAARRPV